MRVSELREFLLLIRELMRRVMGVSGVSAPNEVELREFLLLIRKIMRKVMGVSGISVPNEESLR